MLYTYNFAYEDRYVLVLQGSVQFGTFQRDLCQIQPLKNETHTKKKHTHTNTHTVKDFLNFETFSAQKVLKYHKIFVFLL